MPVNVRCECGKRFRVSEDRAGKRVRCPECDESVLVREEGKPAKRGGLLWLLVGGGVVLLVLVVVGVLIYRAVEDGNRGIANMTRLGQAFHNFASHGNEQFPTWATFGPPPQRRPLLSWRVQLLPFLDQEELYKQINKDEAWDHPSNQPFHARMPRVFEIPYRPAPPGKTYIQVFVGPQSLFGPTGNRFKIGNIPDGTMKTLLAVEGERAVNWMEPVDIDYPNTGPDQDFQVKGNLGGAGRTFLGLWASGHVEQFPMHLSPRTLNLLIHPADGNPIPPF